MGTVAAGPQPTSSTRVVVTVTVGADIVVVPAVTLAQHEQADENRLGSGHWLVAKVGTMLGTTPKYGTVSVALALKDVGEEALLFAGSSRTTTPATFVGMYLKIVEVTVLRRVSQVDQVPGYGETAFAHVVFGTIVTLRKELHIEMRDSMGTPIPGHCPVTWLAQLSPEQAAARFDSQASRAAPMIRPTCMIGNGMLGQFARGRQDNSASRNTVLIFPTIQRDVGKAFPLLYSPIKKDHGLLIEGFA
ncbi:unnamed protein product [Clonostachys rhizophaga]|uniref:Uncharacterized protein n=1 Tax=Clonostachys rhizophaga TaxID=160324 RepID=A0A9N9V4I6_9HYPO|nr:unnamed protein product [Clonostachys rhizophaga]